ncbi:hypothetical protein EIP86_008242 [Pleurotus ostreatoroseus]|nr:hypothetical protein EIP86_008242 [Pleurotus ostreatoroseus]
MKAQLPVKREMSNSKAPVLDVFGSAVAGLTSIRAYGAQQTFKDETDKRINRYVRCARTYYNLNRWISVRIDALSATFAASLAAYFAYGSSAPNPSDIGFILVMAVSFSQMILFWVRIYNEFEVSGNSLERIQQYIAIEQEPEPKDHGTPPAYWPASGDLRVENLSARYSPDGPKILKGLSFHVQSGERIGIGESPVKPACPITSYSQPVIAGPHTVGRTGAGKSTLALALLRCIHTDGAVYYDGLPTHGVNLDALRSNVTVIPQVPELLSGTLRKNLDLFGQYDDATLNDALRAAGFFAAVSRDPPSGSGTEPGAESDDPGAPGTSAKRVDITLDTPVASGGANLSVGQRQMVALARAIVRKSKLLILDEATSAIGESPDLPKSSAQAPVVGAYCRDYETDKSIQASLRAALARDVTVLTVAHRLQTIMDSDRIMVLADGRIAELGRPATLLRDAHSALRALVEESADRDALYAMLDLDGSIDA